MTSAQLEPSAHAPCTSTTLRATAGFTVCPDDCPAKSIAESTLTAIATNFHSVFICRASLSVIRGEQPSPRERRDGRISGSRLAAHVVGVPVLADRAVIA